MLQTLMQSLRDGVVTTRYPDEPAEVPERFRGAPEPEVGGPFGALPPASVCPPGAIAAGGSADRPAAYTIDLSRCVFCGRCADEPPGGAIRIGREFELSARRREDLLVRIGRDANGRVIELAPEPADTAALGERVAEHIHRTLGRSLHLRHLDAVTLLRSMEGEDKPLLGRRVVV